MNDSQDDRHLHFVRVGENQSIVRTVPCRVETERIGRSCRDGTDGTIGSLRPFPPRLPDVQRLGENIVVDKTRVHGEHAHE